jgi:hypothetical protein
MISEEENTFWKMKHVLESTGPNEKEKKQNRVPKEIWAYTDNSTS